jgi:ABC-type multidrug transport system permease subunit
MGEWIRSAAFIARSDLAFMLRQRETLLWTFAMPLLFFYFIGTVTGGFGGGDPNRPDPLALRTDAPRGAVLDSIVERLQSNNFRVDRPATADAFAEASRRLSIPTFTDDSVQAGTQVQATLELRSDNIAANLDQFRVSRAVYGVVADLAVLKTTGEPLSREALAALASAPRQVTLAVTAAGSRTEIPGGFAQAVPGTMVMFTMLILLTSGAILLVVERQHGLLRRLASTPITPGAVVAGKWISRMALGLVQIAFAMMVGRILFRVDWGPSLPMVVAVLVAWASFNASFALLLGNIARTQPQMAGGGVLTTMVLAALGGCWWPIEITPQWMQSLALVLPTGWTMDALHKLVNFGYGARSAAPHVAALVGSAILCGWGGSKIFRYQ